MPTKYCIFGDSPSQTQHRLQSTSADKVKARIKRHVNRKRKFSEYLVMKELSTAIQPTLKKTHPPCTNSQRCHVSKKQTARNLLTNAATPKLRTLSATTLSPHSGRSFSSAPQQLLADDSPPLFIWDTSFNGKLQVEGAALSGRISTRMSQRRDQGFLLKVVKRLERCGSGKDGRWPVAVFIFPGSLDSQKKKKLERVYERLVTTTTTMTHKAPHASALQARAGVAVHTRQQK